MAEKVLAAVRTGPSKTEIREYPMPDIPEDAALMKMEVAGICGTDVKLYKHPPIDKPSHHGPREHRLSSPRPAASSPGARASRKATWSSSSTT